MTLYRVGTIKQLCRVCAATWQLTGACPTTRALSFTGAATRPSSPRAPLAARPLAARLVGKHCESGDVIVDDARLPADLAVDDIVATPVTGAYGFSMASNYNRVLRPPVVFVSAVGLVSL